MHMPYGLLAGLDGCCAACSKGAPCSGTAPPGFTMVSRQQLLGLGETPEEEYLRLREQEDAAAAARREMESPEPDDEEDGAGTFSSGDASGAPGVMGAGGLYAAGAAGGIAMATGGIMYHSQAPTRVISKKGLKRKEKQSLAMGVGGGAVAGASVGTMIFPGIGTAIGAVVGAGAGAAGSILGQKKLKRANKKLQRATQAEQAAEQQRQLEAQRAAIEAQRAYTGEVSKARLALNRLEREADRWVLTVQKVRGDLNSARALRQELVAIRAETTGADLEVHELLVDQATDSVEDLRQIAEAAQAAAAPLGLSGLGGSWTNDATEHVLATRAYNRAQLGLPPEATSVGFGLTQREVRVAGVAALAGLAGAYFWKKRGR